MFIHYFFFFCGRSAVLRPSIHMLPGIGWCGAGLPPFPIACWWLTHPAAITGVSVSARRDSPGGCGGPSIPLLCNRNLLMSCQTVDCVSRGVVIFSGSFPLTFLSVSDQGFGFLVNMGCSCLLPDLARRSALSFPGIPQWAGIHCRTTVRSWGRSCRSFSSWWIDWSGVLEVRD